MTAHQPNVYRTAAKASEAEKETSRRGQASLLNSRPEQEGKVGGESGNNKTENPRGHRQSLYLATRKATALKAMHER